MLDHKRMEALSFIYYALIPKNDHYKEGRRPLSIAIKSNSKICMEHLLDLLTLNEDLDCFRYLQPYLLKILEMKSPTFFHFLDQHCFRYLLSQPMETKHEIAYLKMHTQYVNELTQKKNF